MTETMGMDVEQDRNTIHQLRSRPLPDPRSSATVIGCRGQIRTSLIPLYTTVCWFKPHTKTTFLWPQATGINSNKIVTAPYDSNVRSCCHSRVWHRRWERFMDDVVIQIDQIDRWWGWGCWVWVSRWYEPASQPIRQLLFHIINLIPYKYIS